MARKGDYYHDENRAHKQPRHSNSGGVGSVVLWIVDIVMMGISGLAGVLLLLALLAPAISPELTPAFAFAGLFYQVVYLVNLGCALWWVVRWKRWFFFSAAVLLLGWGNISLFYRCDLSAKEPAVQVNKEDVVVVSYNVANFGSETEKESLYDAVAEWLNSQRVDIVCLQEAYFYSDESLDYFRSKLERLRYAKYVDCVPEKSNQSEVSGSGFLLLSGHPIVRHAVADVDSLNVNAVWADVKVGRDTLRVYNLHLQSTGITGTERTETLTRHIIADTMARSKLSNVAQKMADNYRRRAAEADRVATHVAQSPHPVVLCGDFNDTPVSYTYNTIVGNTLTDAYLERGRGVEHTFMGLYNLFRIDYVMMSEDEFEVKSYQSFPLEYSDHKPIKVILTPQNQ